MSMIGSSLNPCFSGRWSLTLAQLSYLLNLLIGLNPCFSGRWSLTQIYGSLRVKLPTES